MKLSASFGEKPDIQMQSPATENSLIMSNAKDYHCTQCMSRFKTQHERNLHMEKHSVTRNQPQCRHCNRVVRNSFNRRRHEENCQKLESEEREQRNRKEPLTCMYCKRHFSTINRCRSHENNKRCIQARNIDWEHLYHPRPGDAK